MPRVTALMSVFNSEVFVGQAIESILSQTFDDIEFIIIDDGSIDGSLEIIRGYDDSRIRVVENGANIGLTRSLNLGLEMASGEYIARMDADDVSLPERLEKQVRFLDANPDVGVVGTAVQVIDENDRVLDLIRFPGKGGVMRWLLFFLNPLVHPSVMMRKDALVEVGGYNPGMICSQDYELWWRVVGSARLANLPEVLLQLRRHSDSVTSIKGDQQVENGIRISHNKMSELLNEEIDLDGIRQLWKQQFRSTSAVLDAGRWIRSLCRSFIQDEALAQDEKKWICKNAAARLRGLPVSVWDPRYRILTAWSLGLQFQAWK